MKKIFLLAVMICLAMMSTALAARDYQSVGVVIIGGAEFTTKDYYEIVKDELKPVSVAKILVGNDMQTRYKRYWLSKGFIGEQTPQRQDLIDFAAMSGCNKVVCLVVANSNLDTQNNSNRRQKERITVQLDAYVCTPTAVINIYSASDDEKSKTSNLRARRGAFRKCLEEIAKDLNQHL